MSFSFSETAWWGLDREEPTAPLTHDKGHNCAPCLNKDVGSAERDLAAVLSVQRKRPRLPEAENGH